jgi:tetratricopeptide (TPR) repeat protein
MSPLACKEAIRLDPRNASAHSNLGNALYHKKDLEGAITAHKEAIRLDPRLANARYNLGVALRARGDLEGAISAYRQAIRLAPRLTDAHAALGNALYHKKDLEGAIAACKEAIRLDPRLAAAHYNLGNALQARGDLEGAIAAFKEAIRLDPRLPNAYYNLGIALQARGDVEGAIAAYRQAIRLDPSLAVAHTNLGVVLQARGDLEGAIAAYRQAIRLDPSLANAHGALGHALLQQGRFAEAEKSTRTALELLPARHPLRPFVARQLVNCQRLARLDERLPAVLRGQDRPATAADSLAFAQLCQLRKLHAAAARLWAEAFGQDPRLAADLAQSHRYNAACCAALAASGQGQDAAGLGATERLALRRQALTWLSAELRRRREQLKSDRPGQAAQARAALAHWQKGPDLAGLREPEALQKLPAEERQACEKLWTDVAAALRRAQPK